MADRITFLSSHPGRLKAVLDMDFKKGGEVRSKEDLIQIDGYLDCERQIVSLMRSESAQPE